MRLHFVGQPLLFIPEKQLRYNNVLITYLLIDNFVLFKSKIKLTTYQLFCHILFFINFKFRTTQLELA